MSALFNQLSTDTGRTAYSTNAMDVFSAVDQQGGFGRREGPFSAEGGSTVGNGNAFININFPILSNPMSSASNGRVILHELTHVGSSSSRNYSHYEMARAAYEVALAQGYKDLGTKPSGGDPGGVDASNSVSFSNIQFKACHVK